MFRKESLESWRKGIVTGASIFLGAYGMALILYYIALLVAKLIN